MKISYFILVGFLVILVLFSITTFINFKQAEQVNENSELFSRSTEIVRNSNRFQRNILNMISGLRGYLFTGENYFIEAYDSAAAENDAILSELSTVIPDSSEQSKKLEEILELNFRWINEFADPLMEAKKMSGSRIAAGCHLINSTAKNCFQEQRKILTGRFRQSSETSVIMNMTSGKEGEQILQNPLRKPGQISFLPNHLFDCYRYGYRFFSRLPAFPPGSYEWLKWPTPSHKEIMKFIPLNQGSDELSRLAHALNRMARPSPKISRCSNAKTKSSTSMPTSFHTI
jgi:CHASE3 domain sensor protein